MEKRLPGFGLVFATLFFVSVTQVLSAVLIDNSHLLLSISINEILIIAGIPLLLVFAFKFDREALFPIKRPELKIILMCVVFIFFLDVSIDYLQTFSEIVLPLPQTIKDELNKLMQTHGTSDFVIKIAVLCAIPAICEEILFRGFVQSSIKARAGFAAAIVITSVVFAIFRLRQRRQMRANFVAKFQIAD